MTYEACYYCGSRDEHCGCWTVESVSEEAWKKHRAEMDAQIDKSVDWTKLRFMGKNDD